MKLNIILKIFNIHITFSVVSTISLLHDFSAFHVIKDPHRVRVTFFHPLRSFWLVLVLVSSRGVFV